jgi:hypothetical protein
VAAAATEILPSVQDETFPLPSEKIYVFIKKATCTGSDPARYVALLMPKIAPLSLQLMIVAGLLLVTATAGQAQILEAARQKFIFKDRQGETKSADVMTKYLPKKILHPFANQPGIDPKLTRAATIAEERAHAHSRERCWHYVKEALLASGAVSSYPTSVYAKEAAKELVSNYGFKKLAVRDPFQAPVGSVLVYGARKGAGHVEIRTKNGFASDFRSKIPSPRPLIGVFTKS